MIYTEEQITRANETDLVSFLSAQGEQIIKSGREYRWKAHDSLILRKNKWFRHSESKGGYPISFVMEFYGKNFSEAVRLLTGEEPKGENTGQYASETRKQEQDLKLPIPAAGTDTVMKYLTEERKIDGDTAAFFISRGDIYEDAERHNSVFVGRDREGIPRYAAIWGTKEMYRIDAPGSDKAYGFSFLNPGDQLFVFEAPIDLLSFISLYRKDWEKRSYVSLSGVSEKALTRILAERKDITKIFLCLDHDCAGAEGCARLAAGIPDGYTVTKLVPFYKDWNEVLCERERIPNRKYIADTVILKQTVPMIKMSEVQEESVEWLWYPYTPFGKLTILQENPGEGKTYFAMELAAACTGGKKLPDAEALEPFNIIYQTAEDGLGDTILPRLKASGADLSRVLVIDDSENPLTLSDRRIEEAIMENRAKLLVVDPLQAFMGSGIDMNRANEVRPVFRRLGEIARRTGCAVLMIGHLNKAAGIQSAYRGLGSIDITAAVRSVLFIGKLKGNEDMRILTHEKSSLAPAGISMAFMINEDTGFEWKGPYDITADDLLSGREPRPGSETKTEKAEKLILEMLSEGNRVYVSDIEEAAAKQGISARTVRLAKANLKDRILTEFQPDKRKMISFTSSPADTGKAELGP